MRAFARAVGTSPDTEVHPVVQAGRLWTTALVAKHSREPGKLGDPGVAKAIANRTPSVVRMQSSTARALRKANARTSGRETRAQAVTKLLNIEAWCANWPDVIKSRWR